MSVPTTMPPLESAADFVLSARTIDRYRQDGHVLLRGVARAEEVAAYRAAIHAAVARLNTETRPLRQRDTYGKAFLQIMNLWTRDELVRRYTLAQRFAAIAAELLGAERVRIYHDQALFKEPGGGPTPWHQDQYYWPLDTDKFVTMWMPLVNLTADMGIVRFASGSHRHGYVGKRAISDASEEELGRFVKDRGFPIAEVKSLRAGDATFHAGWTLHSAGPNRSKVMREVMTVIYFADGARVIAPDNPDRATDIDRWLPGLKPGDLAASELNPVIALN